MYSSGLGHSFDLYISGVFFRVRPGVTTVRAFHRTGRGWGPLLRGVDLLDQAPYGKSKRLFRVHARSVDLLGWFLLVFFGTRAAFMTWMNFLSGRLPIADSRKRKGKCDNM